MAGLEQGRRAAPLRDPDVDRIRNTCRGASLACATEVDLHDSTETGRERVDPPRRAFAQLLDHAQARPFRSCVPSLPKMFHQPSREQCVLEEAELAPNRLEVD